MGGKVRAGAPRWGATQLGIARCPRGQRLGPHQLRGVGEKGDVGAAGRRAGRAPGGVRLLHGGRQVGPVPALVLVLVLVQEVARPRRVFEKWLLIVQAIPRGLGGWGVAVESQCVPCGFLQRTGRQGADSEATPGLSP